MKNELINVYENRLKNVLVMDKKITPNMINVIKSEVLYALKNYMEITSSDLNVDIAIDECGFYDVMISAKVRRLITFSSITHE